jgi:hypothetical protein
MTTTLGRPSNREESPRSVLFTLVCGFALLGPAWLGLSTGLPTVLSPFPALTVIFSFFMTSRVGIAIPTLLFLVWNPRFFRGEGRIPNRSYTLLAFLTVFTAVWFVLGWKFGSQYQGPRFTHLMLVVNIAWLLGLWALFLSALKHTPSVGLSLTIHWLLFAWLAWSAFPYLGELP